MRPERPSGASGCPQAQEGGTEHFRAGTCVYVRTYNYARTDDHAYARARARAGSGSGRHACEPNALT
jgi:hypothetical protein